MGIRAELEAESLSLSRDSPRNFSGFQAASTEARVRHRYLSISFDGIATQRELEELS